MIVATDPSRASLEVARNLFTEPELWRLLWVEATFAAEHCLVPVDEPCPITWPAAGWLSGSGFG
jgi:hypothetical protein